MTLRTAGEVTIVTSEVSTCILWEFQDSSLFSNHFEFMISPTFQFGKRSLHFEMNNMKLEQDSGCYLRISNDKQKVFPVSHRKAGYNFDPRVKLETNGMVLTFEEIRKYHGFLSMHPLIPYSPSPSTITLELFNTSGSKKRLLKLCDRKKKRKRLRGLSRNLKKSYLNKLYCDLTIKVKDREFKVHKLMLISQSPVFAAMMEHNMAEKKNNYIDVKDCDPQAFDMFLTYMYSGEIGNVSLENVSDLYVIADKYAVYKLKEDCAEFMKQNLTANVFCDVVELAERHSDSDLLDVLLYFFKKNSKKILRTKGWKSFRQRYARLAACFTLSLACQNFLRKIEIPYNLRSHAAKASRL